MAKIGINGLGRIGRAVLKQAIDHPYLEVAAINDLATTADLVYLLCHDSVYGRWHRPVETSDGMLNIDGRQIRVLHEQDPSRLPWRELDIEIVFECTGRFARRVDLEKHLFAGARYAILSAPAKDAEVISAVPGVTPTSDEQIRSCASCTTNCVAPVIEVLDRHFGVAKAMVNTVHAYTSSQALVDAPHKRRERGRAAGVNLVPTATGAAIAVTRVLPHLAGRIDGVAVRCPVPVGSVADITAVLNRRTDAAEVNRIFTQEAAAERYREIIGVADEPLVSTDLIGDEHAATIDLTRTQVVDGDLLKILAWYDNEWGYAAQMVREAAAIAGVCV